MLINEYDVKKYCCLYASDYHLEMILLPYIKKNLDNSNFFILTQNNLLPTINLLLEKINFNIEDKKRILNLNWNKKEVYNFENKCFENTTIILNGNKNYIENTVKSFKNTKFINSNFIYCYDITDENYSKGLSHENFDAILNSSSPQ